MNTEIISRADAQRQGLTHYYTGKKCKRGHVSLRHVSSRCCVDCGRMASNNWVCNNREKSRDSITRWRLANPEQNRSIIQSWRKNNPQKIASDAAARRSKRLERTPKWANVKSIELIYEQCPEGHHVDHDIPLQGEFVSGLHVETNLQYLSQSDNASKGNRYPYWWL